MDGCICSPSVSAGVTHATSLLSLLVLHPPPSNGVAKHF